MTDHSALANSELHEPKGISTASDNTLYVATGGGTGEWVPLLGTAGSWTHSSNVSEVEFTSLGGFGMLQVDLAGIELTTTTDQHILMQLGNDNGYTTSSIYYSSYWSSNNNGNEELTGINLGYFRHNSPAGSNTNHSACFLTNFNIARYTIATSQEAMDASSTVTTGFSQRTQWVREKKIYNKIKIRTTDPMTAGSIVVSGYRYRV